MNTRLLLCALTLLVASTTVHADIACDDPRIYHKDLNEAQLNVWLALFPGLHVRPASITALNTTDGPIYQLVSTCDEDLDWVYELGMSSAEYQTFFDKNAKAGYRPLIVEVYGTYPNEKYLSVMIDDGVTTGARHRVTTDNWASVRSEMTALNFMPTWFSSCGTGEDTRYACIWANPGNGDGMRTLTNLAPADFDSLEENERHQGSRLISVSVHGTITSPKIGGFFTRGIQPEWSVHIYLTSTELEDLVTSKQELGWEPHVITAYDYLIRRYIAVFKRDPARTFRITGTTDAGFEGIDALIEAHMKNGMIPRGALAITDTQGRLVLARGYTWDSADTVDTEPTNLFRVASVSKPLTAAATMALIEDDPSLNLDDPVSLLLDDWEWCAAFCFMCTFLDCDDPFWPGLTYRHLLSHHSGLIRWSGGSEGDAMGADRTIRDTLNSLSGGSSVTLPISLDDIHEFMRKQGFDILPGTSIDLNGNGEVNSSDGDLAYSNYGYSLLGRIIEAASGMTYEEYMQERILDPLCINRMQIGSSLGDAVDEVEYHDSMYRSRLTVIENNDAKWVPNCYGGSNIPNYDAHGGWIASVVDLVAFTAALRDPTDSPILSEASINEMFDTPDYDPTTKYALGWGVGTSGVFHTGSINGTNSAIQRYFNGSSCAVVFNRRVQDATGHDKTDDQILGQISNAWSSISWPNVDYWDEYHCFESNPADINGDGRVDGVDLAAVLGSWGGSGEGDVSGDGVVDGVDLAIVLGAWTH